MTLNGVMAVTLCHFTEFGKHTGILSFVRGFTCPEVQTRNPTQPRVREKVKATSSILLHVHRAWHANC